MNRFWEKWVSMVIYIRDIRNSLSSFYQRTSKTLLYVLSHVQLFATPWTVACKAPLSMEFFRQVYWVGYYCLLHGIFPPQGSNPGLLHYRQILYGLIHQESPDYILVTAPELLVAQQSKYLSFTLNAHHGIAMMLCSTKIPGWVPPSCRCTIYKMGLHECYFFPQDPRGDF